MSAVWALTAHSDARNEVIAPVRWFSLLATVCQYGLTGQVLQRHKFAASQSAASQSLKTHRHNGHQRLAASKCLRKSSEYTCIILSVLDLDFVVLFP